MNEDGASATGSRMAEALVVLYGGTGWKEHPEWSQYLLSVEDLEVQRTIGDPLADEVLSALGDLKPGQDAFGEIERLMTTDENEEPTPAPVSPAVPSAVTAFWDETRQPPDWVDWEAVQRGQEVFWRFAGPKLMLLMHFSLLVGVSAPKVNRVLLSTGYLTRPGERTFRRLLETTSWLVAIMETDSLRSLGSGWKACLRVRLLHAHVRQKLRALGAKDSQVYDESIYGVPINQEDSAATILAFSVGPIAGLQRMGISLTEQQREDYCALWRYVGWLMGVSDAVNPCRSFGQAAAAAISIVRHISAPDESSKTIAQALLQSCAAAAYKREPKYSEEAWMGFLNELTRNVVGDDYADAIGVQPVTDWWTRMSVWLLLKYYWVSASYLSEITQFRQWRIQRAKTFIPKMLQDVLGGIPKFLLSHEPNSQNLADQ